MLVFFLHSLHKIVATYMCHVWIFMMTLTQFEHLHKVNVSLAISFVDIDYSHDGSFKKQSNYLTVYITEFGEISTYSLPDRK